MQKMRQRGYFQTSFFGFLKKPYMRQKQVICRLVSIYLDSPQIGMRYKKTVENFRLLIQRYDQF